jgi:hypothetical protein
VKVRLRRQTASPGDPFDARACAPPRLEALLQPPQALSACARHDREAEPLREAVHRPVRRKHLANEADHALHSSAAFETDDEETPDTLTLPSGDPRLRHHVAAFPNRHFLAFDEDRCEKREVVVVVDAREAVEQGSRQLVQGAEEAVSPRFGGEAADEILHELRVLRQDRAEHDALAAGPADDIDQFGRIAMNRVGHDLALS